MWRATSKLRPLKMTSCTWNWFNRKDQLHHRRKLSLHQQVFTPSSYLRFQQSYSKAFVVLLSSRENNLSSKLDNTTLSLQQHLCTSPVSFVCAQLRHCDTTECWIGKRVDQVIMFWLTELFGQIQCTVNELVKWGRCCFFSSVAYQQSVNAEFNQIWEIIWCSIWTTRTPTNCWIRRHAICQERKYPWSRRDPPNWAPITEFCGQNLSPPMTSQCLLIQNFAPSATVWPVFQCQSRPPKFLVSFWGVSKDVGGRNCSNLGCV